MRGSVFLATVCGAALCAGAAFAQPAGGEQTPAQAPAAPPAGDAKAWIERQLEQTREREDRLKRALEMLEQGKSMDEVRRFLADEAGSAFMRDRRRERAGGERPGGPGARPGGGPAGEGRGPEGEDAPAGPLDEEQTRQALGVLQDTNPPMHERFRRLLEENPQEARRALGRFWPRLRELAALREHDPEAFAARRDELVIGRKIVEHLWRLRRELADMTDEQRTAAEGELRTLVAQQFDARLQARRKDLEHAARRVEQQRDGLAKAETDREKMIQQRTEELMRRAADPLAEPLPGEFPGPGGDPMMEPSRRMGPGGPEGGPRPRPRGR